MGDNEKRLLYKHKISHELSELNPEYSAYQYSQFKLGLDEAGLSLPKAHAELYPSCPKCGSMRRSTATQRRSKKLVKISKKEDKDVIKNYIVAVCRTCEYSYRLPGSTLGSIRDYEDRRKKHIQDLTYDPTAILEEMSSGGSAQSSRAPSPMPVAENPSKRKKKTKQPSSLQELLQRNKMREMDKSMSKVNNNSKNNAPSSGLGAFLSSYD